MSCSVSIDLQVHNVSVIQYKEQPQHIDQALAWLQQEWSEFDPPVPIESGSYPDPLFATTSDTNLVGVLTFTCAGTPEHAEPAVWINTLFVPPEARGLGIASKLVQHAMQDSDQALWVLTAYTTLYTQLGWQPVTPSQQADKQIILRYAKDRQNN